MDELPDEILEVIFLKLDGFDLCRCSMVCKRWRDILTTDYIWKNACLANKVKEEPELTTLYGNYVNECGLWKSYYRLHADRLVNWKKNRYTSHTKGGESWFFQGWSSHLDTCLLPTYTENTVDIFRITQTALITEQQILLPVPGLEPTFLLADKNSLAVAKSNITLMYRKSDGEYKLFRLFACRNGSIVKFVGDPQNLSHTSRFIRANYIRCGMVRVIEFKNGLLWLCDYNSGRLFVIEDDRNYIEKWYTIDSVTFFKTGSGYVCFWTNKCLSLCDLEGYLVFVLTNIGIDFMSFTDNYIGVKFTNSNLVETWDIKRRKNLTSINVTPDTSLAVHNEVIILLQLQTYSLSCHNIHDGSVKWTISYKIPGPPRAPLFTCQLSVILNKILLIFPSHRYGYQAARFSAINVDTGEYFYNSQYNGMVVEVSDRLLVTLGSRKDNEETGNSVYIRSYI